MGVAHVHFDMNRSCAHVIFSLRHKMTVRSALVVGANMKGGEPYGVVAVTGIPSYRKLELGSQGRVGSISL